ncbi:acyl-CoA oxidase [Marchantia polymorpha subsp. ruderalis]|uniref:Acyl-coenzyme A oxidase n=2 Tax=Marchantia polymorpha TaxID=3197 RepID=A0A176WTU5_MARPO|nr:hypothetical protein AXG93_1154s1820 [Marchantia polymorpha subsp. ruderalis]PTQ47712.1 hypothetical protein MARPO_0007s0119 [Marchantia polymorpha]BBN04025.1 hypothetical protein Mp_3g01250 [Marchantia polymorpha subsp. ruderalis]|eukprot:PTQ47712.1 hypothetical protein MARPO_0007s0119 [Marchantia polymorpha]
MENGGNRLAWRASVLAKHFSQIPPSPQNALAGVPCLQYGSPEENSGKPAFDITVMRKLMDGHSVEVRDQCFELMRKNELFHLKTGGSTTFLGVDYGALLHTQREITMERLMYMRDSGVFKGLLTVNTMEQYLTTSAVFECMSLFDHSLSIKAGVHFHLWGGAVLFLGTKRHHDKWLKVTEEFGIRGCFAMTELGHGSNVRGIETVTTYDPTTQEFIINTPCESAQKYWIGGAAQHATHTIVFSQLYIGGKNEGVHALICQIRDSNGKICPGVRIADCGLKIGLNGVDNGRLWFDNVRVPRENLLNSVADVTPEGKYVSSITDPDQRFGAFMAPLTTGRVTIAVAAVYQSKVALATAIRYALSRRAFAMTPNQPEVLLLDYPSHQQRLLTLLAKSYAMSLAGNKLKMIYGARTPADAKTIHVLSSGLKALLTWHFMRTAQECREACGGQGLKTENKVGQLKGEYDVQLTFEGDNNVLMQQVSKALLADYFSSLKRKKPVKSVGLDHMNAPRPIIPAKFTSDLLRNSKFQLALFQLRERDLLERLAEDVTQRVSRGVSPAEAANQSYQLGCRLGEAFSEKQVLEAHLAAETEQTGSIKDVLGLLRSLYVLSVIDESPVFLRYGLLTSTQSQIIHQEVAALCGELRPHALALVDSLGIPLDLLGPIASDWVEHNSYKNVLA